MDIRVGPADRTIHFDDEFLVCGPDATVERDKQQGYFVADTRLVSDHHVTVDRTPLVQLNSSEVEPFSARFEFINPQVDSAGGRVEQGEVHVRIDRTIGSGIHEDYDLESFATDPVELFLAIYVEGDYVDLLDMKQGKLVRRGTLQSTWDQERASLTTTYRHDDFQRGLVLTVDKADSEPEYAAGRISFRVRLAPRQHWHSCLLWCPVVGGRTRRPQRPCHALLPQDHESGAHLQQWSEQVTGVSTSDPDINRVVTQATRDLVSLRMRGYGNEGADSGGQGGEDDAEAWVPAAGVPWFVTLFGRDALTVSLQTLSLSPRFSQASLRAHARLQADDYDDAHDRAPGKIEHEIRHGELAHFGLIPQTPYYGTHDATTLYVWLAAQLWDWTGNRTVLKELRPNVERALQWIDNDGDLDGDGLQEYQTRAGDWGYYNLGWKDAGDAIVDQDGSKAALPLATCELQGYVVAAKRDWARVLEQAFEDHQSAKRLRDEAERLVEQIETRFWWADEDTYYLGLDGHKQPIRSVASNPGQLLWTGAVSPERATAVGHRLLADDMWSGWGIRTLSAKHAAYQPLSYQRGSVWPHDNAIIASGLLRYGLREQAWQVGRALFDAAVRFHHDRLPEVFAGITRDPGSFPVQYLGANVPQAWASGAVVQLIASLAGLAPEAGKRLRVSPSLPPWLDHVQLTGLRVGNGSVDLHVSRAGGVEATTRDGGIEILPGG